MSYEVELLALAVILYVYDSSVLLFSNEAILTCDTNQCWSATTGRPGFMIAGRTLCILNLLTPHRPSFRLSWNFDGLNSQPSDSMWSIHVQEWQKFARASLGAGIALFVLLPVGMFTLLGAYAIIPAVLLLYGSTLFALFHLRRKGTLLALDGRRFLGVAFECLACPPFAVNMVRRVTLARKVAEPVPLAAIRLLNAERWKVLREECISRLDEAMLSSPEHSAEQRTLEAQKQRLRALG